MSEKEDPIIAFINELYALMVDPLVEGEMKVADMTTAILKRAKEDRTERLFYWPCTSCGSMNTVERIGYLKVVHQDCR